MNFVTIVGALGIIDTCFDIFVDEEDQREVEPRMVCEGNLPIEVSFRENPLCPVAAARQTFFKNSIYVNPQFKNLVLREKRFILLHECGHLHHNDPLKGSILHVIRLIAGMLLFQTLVPFVLYNVASGFFLSAGLGSINERRADAFARKNATLEELQGGISFLMRRKLKEDREWREAPTLGEKLPLLMRKLSYNILQGHPSDGERISLLIEELRSRVQPIVNAA